MKKLIITILSLLLCGSVYAAWKYNPHTGKLDFYEDVETTGGFTDGGSSVYLTTSGDNVGIGTSSPTQKLDVNGVIKWGNNTLPAGTGANTQVLVANGTGGISWGAAGTGDITGVGDGAINNVFNQTDADTDSLQGNLVGIGYTHASAFLNIKPSGTGTAIILKIADTSAADRLVVLQNGNVGIGTTGPGDLVNVYGANKKMVFGDVNVHTNLYSSYNSQNWQTFEFVKNVDESMNGLSAMVFTVRNSNPNLAGDAAGVVMAVNKAIGTEGVADLRLGWMGFGFDAVNKGNITWWTNNAGSLGERMRITSAGNVGIGTTGPIALTHISQAAAADAFRVDDAAGDITPFSINAAGNVGIGTTGARAPLELRQSTTGTGFSLLIGSTAPVYNFAVLDNGNVGIATTAPAASLDVAGKFFVDSNGNLTKIDNITYDWPADDGDASEVLTTNGSGVLTWEAVAGSGDITAVGDAITGAVFAAGDTDTLLGNLVGIGYTHASAFLNIKPSGTGTSIILKVADTSAADRLVVLQNGNVGIGITNPTQVLDVVGTVKATTFSGAGTSLTGTAASLTAGTVTTNANLTGPITSSGNTTSIAAQTGTGTTFVVNTAPTIAGNALFSGNIGIGNSSPTQRLLVTGTIQADSGVYTALTVGGQNAVTVTTAHVGDVTGPITGLTVVDDSHNHTGDSISGVLYSDLTATTSANWDDVVSDETGTGGAWVFATAPTMTGDVKFSGNVGIGVSAPTQRLDVSGTVNATTFVGALTGNASGSAATVTGAAQTAITSVGALTALNISGNLGVGVSSPTQRIDVSGTVKATAFSGDLTGNVTGNASGTALTVTQAAQTAITSLGALTALNVSGNTGLGVTTPTQRLDVLGAVKVSTNVIVSGNVGIGISTPTQLLDVNGLIKWGNNTLPAGTGTNNQLLIANGTGGINWGNAGAADNLGNHTATANIQLSTFYLSGDGGAEGVHVTAAGNVGVGTTAPTATLHVAGDIKSQNTIPLARLNIIGVTTSTLPGFQLNPTKNYTIREVEAQVRGSGATNCIFTLALLTSDGTSVAHNLCIGQTAALAKLELRTFTGGTAPAGYIIQPVISVVNGGATAPDMRLEIWGDEY